jgi:tetratricopeptide (TPR) repeat protein/tRNA A-37 threonylcarbamoyl transferase component Bud32
MGVVYQAWDEALGVAVALKVIRPEVMSDPYAASEIERRFKRELLLARQVTHKHVVRIHDLGEIDGIKYLTMPFVDGRNLAEILREAGSLPVPRALRLARQVAHGLAAAHEAGVVHRDLKPENVMIDADEHAVIMDFGISRSTSGTNAGTALGQVVGTLEYMAPEQGRGEAVDHRADTYAFGLMLYDMLAGRRRLQGSNESAVSELMLRMAQGPTPLGTVAPHVPEPLQRIVARCVQPDAAARYQTTEALIHDLEDLTPDGHARVEAPVPAKPRSRLPWLIAAVAGLAIVALSILLWQQPRGAPAAPAAAREPVSVLIADFENNAGDAVFDGTVEQALAISMEGAPFIAVYPRRDARAAATQVSPDGGGRVDRETGRLIARREGLRFLVAGGVSRAGDGYLLTVESIDAASDGAGRVVTREVRSKGEVLGAISGLAAAVVKNLGGTESDGAAFGDETFTAGSLEAMAAYARGQDLSLAGKPQEALQAYEEAVRLDPSFGRALAGMAVIYGNLKRPEQSEASYQKAFQHLDRMTERERYRTLGAYYLLVARNYDKAVENYRTLVEKYPADNAGHANLAIAYLQRREVARAMEEGKRAIEIYPRNLTQRTNYAMYAMYAGDFATAIKQASEVLGQHAALDFAVLTLARSQAGAGDAAAAAGSYERLRALGDVGASWAALGLADLAMYQARFADAVGLLEAGIAADEKAGNAYDAAAKLTALSEAHMALGQRDRAVAAARRAVKGAQHESVLFPAGRVLLEAGLPDEAARVATTLEDMLQTQTSAYARLLKGEIALSRGRRGEAVDLLRQGMDRQDSWFARYLLGRAYLDADRPAEALPEFEACVARKGEATDAFIADAATLRYFPPVLYWRGRAHEALGAAAAARASYAEYLKIRSAAAPADALTTDAVRRSAQ